MNGHVKRWIDSIVSRYPEGHEFYAYTIKDQLITERGTTYVVDTGAIGWYLNRKDNVITKGESNNRRVYMRV